MQMGQKITISGQNKAFILTDSRTGERYQVTSVNENCTNKLKKLMEKNDGKAYMTLEPITEYHSDEYRCKVSAVCAPGWQNDDAFCLVAAA